MMLTIHGLPVMVKYHELKTMIKQECNLNDFILDNLTADVDGYKKVRIGVADEGEGAHLCKCLNGFRMGGSVLRVVPVGKAPIQTNFDQRGGFMVRNDVMPNQQGNYANQPGTFGNQFNQPQAQNPWNTGPQNNQWSGNQPPQNQMRPSNFDYQQRPGHQFPGQQQSIMGMSPGNKSFGQSGPAFNQSRPGPTDQGFGFMQKPGVPQTATQIRSERSHVLRSVDIVQTPVHTNRYSEQKYDQNKPVVINKDNFQGPGQFNTSQQGYPQGSIQPVPWSKLQKSPFGKPDVSPFEGNQRPKDFEKSTGSHDRKVSPQDRRVHSASGPLRPPDRRPSPVRRVSPGRRNSPGRRMSPGRRVSPSDRRAPIRKSPTRSSPLKRTSPGRRLVSPGRENLRYSPSRRHDKPDYADSRGSKSVRPAYEPDAKAPNQAMYSDGYRPHVRDNVTYSARQNDQRSSSWQDRDKNTFPGGKNQDDDRRIVRGAEQEAKRSPIRKSRSPNRRDVRERSPLRDRYRRHSPSPRSPRRSWALEKRRSPEISDAPPPPVWPGQTQEVPYPRSTTKADGTKHIPVWDHRTYEETEDALRRENRSYDEDQMRIRRDGGRRDEIPHSNRREPSPRRHDFKSQEERNRDPKFEPRDPKFAPRDPKFDHRDPKFELREPHVSRFDQRDPKFEARGPEFRSRDPKFEERDPKFPPHVPRFEPREPKLDVRAPHFEPRDPKFEQRNPRDPKFDSREPKFEPRDSKFDKCHAKYDSHDPKFELREPKFDIRDPKFGSRDLNYGPRDPKFEAREPKFEPRDPKFEPRGPKFDPRDPKFDPRDPKFDPRDPKFDPRDPKFDPRDPKFEPREPKFEPRDQKFESRGPKFEPRDPKFEQRGPKFEPRDPKFEPRDPKFELRNPKFEPRGPKFEPRDLKFEPRDPKFEPRDPKLEQRGPKFETRDPKFDPRDPKYNSRDPNYRPRSPTFESRDPKLVPRRNEFAGGFDPSSHKPHPRDRDYEPQDPNFVSAREKLRARDTKYEHRESKFKPTFEPVASDFPRELDCERNPKYGPRDPKFDSDYKDHHRADTERDDFRHKKREPNREEIHRQDERKEIRHPRDPIDEEFEDIYKRTIEFKQKVEELKRVERNRENYARDGRRDDRRKNDESDRPYREDYHKMDLERHSHEDRPRSRHSDEKREPEWKSREVIPRKIFLPPAIKVKRDKAVEEIVNKLMHKYGNFEMTEEMKNRANDELKLSVSRIMFDMFGTEDISFIELVVKFNSKHGQKEELKIFEDVMSCFPKHHRILKRPAQDANNSEIPEKSTRVTAHNEMDQGSKGFVRPRRKPVTVARKTVSRPTVAKAKLVEDPKKVAPPLSVKPNADGCYELDVTTTRALVDELQKVMIKVWQVLPDEAPTEEETMVVETLRNEASDDLRNTLGLNVTKRLLNKFNPLNVKVHFSTKPERKYLKDFLKRYNFVAFKRILRVTNTFAAQVKTIADFDDLCSTKNIYCGAAKITIAPCYRFTQCPKNIKTIYGAPEDDNNATCNEERKERVESVHDKPEPKETKTETEKPQPKETKNETEEKQEVPSTKTDQKDTNEIVSKKMEENTSSKTIGNIKSGENVAVTKTRNTANAACNVQEAKVAIESKAQTVGNKAPVKSDTKTSNIDTTTNVQAQSTVNNKTVNVTDGNKTTVKNTIAVNTKSVSVSATKQSSNDNNTVSTNTAKSNDNKNETVSKSPTVVSATKTVDVKVTTIPAATLKAPNTKASNTTTTNKNTNKNTTSNAPIKSKDVTSLTKTTSNTIKVAKKVAETKTVTSTKPSNVNAKQIVKRAESSVKKQPDTKKTSKGDDFEELDDNELYQYLMSAGIVLDECSGSDDE